MTLRGLIFDVDGVLVDTVPFHYAAWDRMFTERGYRFDEALYRSHVDGKSRLDGIRAIMGDAAEAEVAQAAATKQGYYLEMLEESDLEAFPDAVRLITRGLDQGLAVASASSSRNAPQVLHKIGLADSMEAMVTGADINKGKPDPEIFVTASSRLGLTPAECAVFEDAAAGVDAANRGGFVSVGVDRRQAHHLSKAHLVVASLDEVSLPEIPRIFDRNR